MLNTTATNAVHREAVKSLRNLRDALDNGDENTAMELEATSGAVKCASAHLRSLIVISDYLSLHQRTR